MIAKQHFGTTACGLLRSDEGLPSRSAIRHPRWSPTARQFVSRVYWPLNNAKRIEDFGSPPKSHGPDRCPHPLPAVGTIPWVPTGSSGRAGSRDGRSTAAHRHFRSVSHPVRAGCVPSHRPCLGPVLSELPCGFFGAIERNGDYVSGAVLKSPRDQPPWLSR